MSWIAEMNSVLDLTTVLGILGGIATFLTIIGYATKLAGGLARVEQIVTDERAESKDTKKLLQELKNSFQDHRVTTGRLEQRVETLERRLSDLEEARD